jgi:ParB/RepB/Spo0J family partition protein
MTTCHVTTLIPISAIEAGRYRTRMFGNPVVDDLAEDIAKHGLLQPIGVVADGEKYHIVFGDRRFTAVKKLNWTEIPAQILPDAKDAMLLAVTENLQRQDLNPVEEARAFRRVLETAGMTQVELAKAIGRSEGYVSNKLRLEKLPRGVAVLCTMSKNPYTEGHLRQLLRLEAIVPKRFGDGIPDGHEFYYEPMFRLGENGNGVVDMVTYWQDKIAWSNLDSTVKELKEAIDLFASGEYFSS